MSKQFRNSFTATVQGSEVRIDNYFNSYSYGFSHTSKLYIDGLRISEAVIGYINRTWECYRYQTVMCGAMRQLEDDRRKYLENKFKEEKGYGRLTDKRRLELEDVFTADKFLNEYEEVLKNLRNY